MRFSFLNSLPLSSRVRMVAGFIVSASCVLFAQQPSAPSSSTPKTAEQQFKNIQTLKGVPADQVIPTMQFIAASLGVECDFCHVERAFDKDDKKTKQVARQMIEMQMSINKNSFKGETEVTCNTCHRGSNRPMSIPAVADANWKPNPPHPEASPTTAPPQQDANAIISKYIDALGGTAALQNIKSLSEKGTAEINGKQTPIDVYAKTPDQRVSLMHVGNGDSVTAFNGKAGWLASPGRPVHDMSPSEAASAKLSAEFTFPENIAKQFTRTRVGRPDKIDDRSVTPVFGMREGQPPVRMFFDDQTGLLTRIVIYTETALGRNPTQVDYADYREVSGVKTPYRWTISRPASRFTIQLTEVKPNAPIDESKFVRPPDPPPSATPTPSSPH